MHLRHGRPHRIRGWALFKSRAARLAQRRYMRLIHYTLTVFDAADEDADLVILDEGLVGAQVSGSKRKKEINIKLSADKLTINLRTDREYDVWFTAFRDAARVATDFYKIVTTRELGAGAFSNVYFGFDREDGHHVAIKVVDKRKCSKAELTCAETEARMMAYLRHPSIVLCRDIFDAPDAMHVVMEYMSGATLEQRMLATAVATNPPNASATSKANKNLIPIAAPAHANSALSCANTIENISTAPGATASSTTPSPANSPTTSTLSAAALSTHPSAPTLSITNNNGSSPGTIATINLTDVNLATLAEGLHAPCFEEPVAATVMGHVLSALAYLESEGVCHRDVKPDNILLSTLKNDKLWATSARLSDFGLASFVESDYELFDIVGTPHYVAPEVIMRDDNDEFIGYGPPVDVWAAGVMMYWMLTGGHYPFDGKDSSEIFKKIRAGKFVIDPQFESNFSPDARSLLYSLLNNSSWIRLSAAGAITHPWLLQAQDIHLPAQYADRLKARKTRRADGWTVKNRWRSATFAVMLVQGLMDIVSEMGSAHNGGNNSTTGTINSLTNSVTNASANKRKLKDKKRNIGLSKSKKLEKMTKAPERAPVGADGLGYNVGLFPSFTPKRRAKAGNLSSNASVASIESRPSRSNINSIDSAKNSDLQSASINGSSSGTDSAGSALKKNSRGSVLNGSDKATTTSKREKWFGTGAAHAHLGFGSGLGAFGALGFGFGGSTSQTGGGAAGSGSGDERASTGGTTLRLSRESRRSVSSGGSRTPSRDRGVSIERHAAAHDKAATSFDKRGGSVDRKSVGSSGHTLSNMTWTFLVRGGTAGSNPASAAGGRSSSATQSTSSASTAASAPDI